MTYLTNHATVYMYRYPGLAPSPLGYLSMLFCKAPTEYGITVIDGILVDHLTPDDKALYGASSEYMPLQDMPPLTDELKAGIDSLAWSKYKPRDSSVDAGVLNFDADALYVLLRDRRDSAWAKPLNLTDTSKIFLLTRSTPDWVIKIADNYLTAWYRYLLYCLDNSVYIDQQNTEYQSDLDIASQILSEVSGQHYTPSSLPFTQQGITAAFLGVKTALSHIHNIRK